MENDEKEEKLNRILKDLFTNFCHDCFEDMCNQALSSIHRFKIEKEKSASCYLMFLHEKILNTEIECKNKSKGCCDRIMFGELEHHLRECRYSTYNLKPKSLESIMELGNLKNYVHLGLGNNGHINGASTSNNTGINTSASSTSNLFSNLNLKFNKTKSKNSKLSISSIGTIQINHDIKEEITNLQNISDFNFSEASNEFLPPYKDLVITSSSASIINGVTTGMSHIIKSGGEVNKINMNNTNNNPNTQNPNKKHNKKKKKKNF